MEILEPVHPGSQRAVFTVEVDGVRTELPWVENAQLRDGILVLSAVLTGSGQAAVTYLREFTQAAWQTSVTPAPD
ncbi:hypothetical protein [Nocardioides sp.]|uniref:hypothetical protein n=1 Tax=Nocardioides sp. TaxID=35761 RepID=UPI001A284170|nr:hypothetical protein [Nocardioides sp.]MBJ7357505.1 hypothetical protein [Nocardioides sp.]